MSIDKGDVVGILGPCGSGKTTLRRCINFLEKGVAGHVTFGDIEMDLHNAKKKDIHAIRQRIVFMFQNYNLFTNKAALENVIEGIIVDRK